jgi:hypothetical protein
MSDPTTPLPFQPTTMTTAQLAAVSYLARYTGCTHTLYAYQLRQWFTWCQTNGVDPLIGIQRAHVELYIRGLGDRGLMDSSVNTMMHAVRGYFRFAYIDDLIGSDPAVYARLPKDDRTHRGHASRSAGRSANGTSGFVETVRLEPIDASPARSYLTTARNAAWCGCFMAISFPHTCQGVTMGDQRRRM